MYTFTSSLTTLRLCHSWVLNVVAWVQSYFSSRIFVVDTVALGLVFSKYFGFLCQFPFHYIHTQFPHIPSGAGKMGHLWPIYQGTQPYHTLYIKRIIKTIKFLQHITLFWIYILSLTVSSLIYQCFFTTVCNSKHVLGFFPLWSSILVIFKLQQLFSLGRQPPVNMMGGWMRLRPILDVIVKKQSPHSEQNQTSAMQYTAHHLY
jgi:hypothetical protein